MFKVTAAALAAAALVGTATAAAVQPGCHRGSKRSVRTESAGDALGTVATHTSGLIRIGVNHEGNLNWYPRDGYNTRDSVGGTTPYGLRYVDADPGHILDAGNVGAEYESTAPGCLCEGWGAGAWDTAGSFLSGGSANEDDGYPGISNIDALIVTPSNDANAQNVTASVQAGGCLRVKHEYFPSPVSRYLYEVDVTLTNICDFGLGQVKYVRVMDWDEEPTAFRETVELSPGNALDLECLHDDGFANADPTNTGTSGIVLGNCAPQNVVTQLGVADHGAYFRFNFHDINSTAPLAPGASRTLKTFYGAAPTRSIAAAALMAVDAEAFSFGHSTAGGNFGDSGYTTIFGFAGVGGDVVVIPDDSFTAPCDACSSVHVASEGNSVTLSFAETGPYNAVCQ